MQVLTGEAAKGDTEALWATEHPDTEPNSHHQKNVLKIIYDPTIYTDTEPNSHHQKNVPKIMYDPAMYTVSYDICSPHHHFSVS
jgi:hypothetical protein